MSGYQCPECGGRMYTEAHLSDPPIYEARCYDCKVLYRKRRTGFGPLPLPRDYDRVTPPRDTAQEGE